MASTASTGTTVLGGVQGLRTSRRASRPGSTGVERYQVIDQLTLLVDKSPVVAENTKRANAMIPANWKRGANMPW